MEECRKIDDVICEVKYVGMMDKVFKRFVTQKPNPHSDIPQFSHYFKSYFEPARKKHECGDYSGAMTLYKEAVESGSQLACFILSQYYLQGIGVERDISRFFSLLEKGGVIRDDHIDVYRSIVSNGFFGGISLDLNINHSFQQLIMFLFHLFIILENNRRFWSVFSIKST